MGSLTGAERGFLLLTSHLGDPERRPLTMHQFRELAQRTGTGRSRETERDVDVQDLMRLGYTSHFAGRIADLLNDEFLLDWYLSRAGRAGCVPITRASENYPLILRKRLGEAAPGVLWARGDRSFLNEPAIALVGSRDLREENRVFAEEAGRQAARQGLVLVSGNARGSDKAAQNACLEAGGRVISIVADPLLQHTPRENLLYLSENGYDEAFSAQRALSRNRVIHALGRMVFVAQAALGKGGTWDGTVKNLRYGWSSVACFRDGSEAFRELEQQGAYGVAVEDLEDLSALLLSGETLFDR